MAYDVEHPITDEPGMGTLIIRLGEKLEADLERLSTQQERTKSELVRDILRRHTCAELFQTHDGA